MKKWIDGTSLEYKLWHNNESGQARIEYLTMCENLVVTNPLQGVAHEADKGKILLALRNLKLRGLAYFSISHPGRMQKERAATKPLSAHFECQTRRT